MPKLKSNITLAISAGTRSIGIAVFEGLDLLYYGTKEAGKHRRAQTPHSRAREAVRTIEELINKYQPDCLALFQLNAIQRLSPKLTLLVDRIGAIARRRNIAVYEYTPAQVRREVYQSGRATRRAVAGCLTIIYPELARYLLDVTLWQQLYYARMFNAIAAGYVCARETERQRERLLHEIEDKRGLISSPLTTAP